VKASRSGLAEEPDGSREGLLDRLREALGLGPTAFAMTRSEIEQTRSWSRREFVHVAMETTIHPGSRRCATGIDSPLGGEVGVQGPGDDDLHHPVQLQHRHEVLTWAPH
jgi:hypothetical protein